MEPIRSGRSTALPAHPGRREPPVFIGGVGMDAVAHSGRWEATRHAGAGRGAALGPQASGTDLGMRNITPLNPGGAPLQRALLVINLILKTGRATSHLGRRRQRSPGRVSHGRRHPSGRYLPAPDRRTAQPDGRLSQTTGPISGWSNRLVRRQTGRHPVNRPAPRPRRPRTRESQHHEGPAVGEGQPPSPLAIGLGRAQSRGGTQGAVHRARPADPTGRDAPGGVVQARQGLGARCAPRPVTPRHLQARQGLGAGLSMDRDAPAL